MKPGWRPSFGDDSSDFAAAALPRILWLELTSACPFDCIFCSRRMRRGTGQHLDFDLYRSIIRELQDPELIRLNYSGESIHYPHLIDAIKLAISTGAETELTTAFSSASDSIVRGLAESGLDRLTISLHTLRTGQFHEIYRFSSLEDMRNRIDRLAQIKRELGVRTPRLEFAFVAMKANLAELPRVASYANEIGVSDITVFPVIRRNPIPFEFRHELESGKLRDEFKEQLRHAVLLARRVAKGVNLRVCNPEIETGHPLGRLPRSFPGTLPPEARIRTCEQNPWETVHILADGSVVLCEVQDHLILGNLQRQSLEEIWQGDAYRALRRRYVAGELAGCVDCPWKLAYLPSPLEPRVATVDGVSAQLFRGWHDLDGSNTLWSKKEAVVVLGPTPSANAVQLTGALPPSTAGGENHLEISCNGSILGRIINPTNVLVPFHTCLALGSQRGGTLTFTLKVRTVFRPARVGLGDQRSLGFALFKIELNE